MAGRPKLDENKGRTKQIRIRLTPEEYDELKAACEFDGTSLSSALRSGMLTFIRNYKCRLKESRDGHFF
jgi:hypothetical protein